MSRKFVNALCMTIIYRKFPYILVIVSFLNLLFKYIIKTEYKWNNVELTMNFVLNVILTMQYDFD